MHPSAAWTLLLLLVVSVGARAHENRVLYVEITEASPGTFQLQWKAPASLPLLELPVVSLAGSCRAQGLMAQFNSSGGASRSRHYECVNSGGARKVMTVTHPSENPALATLVRYSSRAGERHAAMLDAGQTTWDVPESETRWEVARQYTWLGVEHIWTGLDHLMFVMCLMWIAGTWKRLLLTITGFSLAHSVTLILSALGTVRLPAPPVEAVIALSVMFVASEIVRGPGQSWTWRYPIAASMCFGLLHGFGFASALRDVGLPQTELVTGLVFFNLGVEIGQAMFALATVAATQAVVRRSGSFGSARLDAKVSRSLTGYLVGSLAAFWLVQRLAVF